MVQKVRYRGSPNSVGVLDSLLRDEGLRVQHREIVERPGDGRDIVDVVVYVDDPDAGDPLDAAPETPIQVRIETAIANLRMSVPRAQAQIVATQSNSPRPPTG